MAAQSGSMILAGHIPAEIGIYFDDSAGAKVRYDDGSGAGAATSTDFIPSRNCVLTDLVLAAATGQTKTQINVGGRPVGSVVLNSIHLASVTSRPRLNIPVPKGVKLEMIQIA